MSNPKEIPARERLIFALDVPSVEEAWRLVERLGDAVAFYKVGLELAMTGGAFELVDRLVARGSKVFLDLKLFDIPETVARAVERLAGRGVTFTTVHGNQRMMEAAARAAHRAERSELKVLAVTVLTSLDQGDLDDLGFETDVRSLVLSRARRALEAGCDGVVTSGLEAEAIRDEVGERLLVVMPGIRPVWNDREPESKPAAQPKQADDQKRTVDVAEAFRRGADYIVVGRPIRDAPDPRAAAEAIQTQIRAAVEST